MKIRCIKTYKTQQLEDYLEKLYTFNIKSPRSSYESKNNYSLKFFKL